MNNKEFSETMQYYEWKKKVDELSKKFDDAEKKKKGSGVL